jgi:hypothetical protein
MIRIAHILSLTLVAGCAGNREETGPDTDVGLPPEDTGSELGGDTGFEVFPIDDSGSELGDEVPSHSLTILQTGDWLLTPEGGPYTEMTGTLRLRERVDGEFLGDTADTADTALPVDTEPDTSDTAMVEPECDVEYALHGEVVEPGCPGCTATFAVTHTLVSGDPGACLDPEAPTPDGVWNLGYDPTAAAILLNYGGSGVWLAWYDATRAGDAITFSWTTTVAVSVDDEEG